VARQLDTGDGTAVLVELCERIQRMEAQLAALAAPATHGAETAHGAVGHPKAAEPTRAESGKEGDAMHVDEAMQVVRRELSLDVLAKRILGELKSSSTGRLDGPRSDPPAPTAAELAQLPMVTAAQLAVVLNVKRDWVYAHADELGARRIGGGRKPRLRFDVEVARAAFPRSAGDASQWDGIPAATANAPIPIRRRSGRRRARLPQPGSVLAVKGREEGRRDAA
jgi:hypothetical protein